MVGLDHCWIGGRGGGFGVCDARPGDVDVTQHMFKRWDAIVAADMLMVVGKKLVQPSQQLPLSRFIGQLGGGKRKY